MLETRKLLLCSLVCGVLALLPFAAHAETADSYLSNKRINEAASRFKPVKELGVHCTRQYCVGRTRYVCHRCGVCYPVGYCRRSPWGH